MSEPTPLISLDGVWRTFKRQKTPFARPIEHHALRGVDLTIDPGAAIAIVGESGSGKSTLGAIITGILTPTRGTARYKGEEYADMPRRRWRAIRGSMPIVPQNATQALNPRMRLGRQVLEPLLIRHARDRPDQFQDRLERALTSVGLSMAIAGRYPHQASGGQRQRILIARALICDPELILFDEATTALDALTQAQILRLIADVRRSLGAAIVFITHDLAAARSVADAIIVLKDGEVAEAGPTERVFERPEAGYTRMLLDALPVAARGVARSGHASC